MSDENSPKQHIRIETGTHNALIPNITKSRPMAVAALGTIILVFMIGFPLTRDLEPTIKLMIVAIGATAILSGIAVELMTYLQSTRQTFGYSSGSMEKIVRDASESVMSDLRAVKKDIDTLKDNQNSTNFSKEEKGAIAANVTEKLTQDITDRIASTWENKYKKAAETADSIKDINNTASEMKMRLRQEVETLSKRANVNLTFGVIISLVGISILSYFIYVTTAELNGGLNTMDVFVRFAIRFSLAAFIQIFAYFFLRLYRYSIFETKYFQNEITNIDARFLALQTAIFTGDKTLLSALAKDLTKTERNFVLKKGDTTVGLRREEMEIDFETNLISRMERLAAIKDGKSSKKEKPAED